MISAKWTVSAAAPAMVIAGVAAAAEPVIVNPDWIKKPSKEEFAAAIPIAAAKSGKTGTARIRCTITVRGLLTKCEVVAEDPAGSGYGNAALLLAPAFRRRPGTRDGVPFESTIMIPFRFDASLLPPDAWSSADKIRKPAEEILIAPTMAWLSTPTPSDVAAAYPRQTSDEQNSPYQVVLRCKVKPDGKLTDCEDVAGTPKTTQLSYAAKSLIKFFRADLSRYAPEHIKKLYVNLPISLSPPAYFQTDRIIAKPEWLRQVDPARAQALFPGKAADAGLTEGRAVLDCIVTPDGTLSPCTSIRETPSGMDFGAAGVRVASAMAVYNWTDTGEPAAGAHVRFAIRFIKSEDDAGKP
ncbi:MAG: TonB family protein [Caulobacteraceae bacterium]